MVRRCEGMRERREIMRGTAVREGQTRRAPGSTAGRAMLALLAVAGIAAIVVGAGCSSGISQDEGLSDADREALASLGYVAGEVESRGGLPEHKRVLVLGIDGMDYLITTRLLDEGKLPTFRKLAEEGGFSPLLSSIPPQSPVAWSNFITGADPGGHGIFDFMHRTPENYFPYLSTSQVVHPPEKARFLGIPVRNRFAVPFTDYVLPIAGGGTLNLRRGVAFWQVLEAAGVPCTIFKIPSNFPPVPSARGLVKSISGMGTPDILGTYGTYAFYTTDPFEGYESVGGGYVYPVEVEEGVVRAKLYGPPNDFKDYKKIAERIGTEIPYQQKKVTIDFEVYVDPENPVAKLIVGDREVLLTEGEFSDWVELEFVMVPHMVNVSGLARFLLKSTHPEFELYVTPVQINPANQILPITDPSEYGKELVDAVGQFYTQNMPEDTAALNHGVFGNAEFVKQSTIVFNERLACFEYELADFDEGLLYFYFGSLDQSTHAMWRCMDPSHPAYDPEKDPEFADFLERLYMKFDDVLARAMEKVDERTTLIVLSDHGFAPFYREFHLNRWLYDEGYLVLKPGTRPGGVEYLFGVDWSRTRAYGLGINALYVNLAGREGQGIVRSGPEADALVDEIAEKLEKLIDEKNGQRIVVKAYKAREVYHGPYVESAPDIIMGYGWGYRGSDSTATGEIPDVLVEDNTNKWSGDHCADYHHVPGILFSNKPIVHEEPSLYDLAPTILGEFGIARRDWMVGRSVFQ
jgi:predicted AlkP superfamily phosphohydrolase/phosphomutase